MKVSGADLAQAIKILKKGGIVVYPTDTAYGLAVDATNAKAVDMLYRLKGRNFKKPIHIIPPQTKMDVFVRISPYAKRLIDKFMPGPITLVLPLKAKGTNWQMLSAGTGTLGIRYPDHPTAQALVELLKKPITTTSANASGQGNCYSIQEVKRQFAKKALKPDYYINGGSLNPQKPSTVVLIIKNRVKILREGPILETYIKRALK